MKWPCTRISHWGCYSTQCSVISENYELQYHNQNDVIHSNHDHTFGPAYEIHRLLLLLNGMINEHDVLAHKLLWQFFTTSNKYLHGIHYVKLFFIAIKFLYPVRNTHTHKDTNIIIFGRKSLFAFFHSFCDRLDL